MPDAVGGVLCGRFLEDGLDARDVADVGADIEGEREWTRRHCAGFPEGARELVVWLGCILSYLGMVLQEGR